MLDARDANLPCHEHIKGRTEIVSDGSSDRNTAACKANDEQVTGSSQPAQRCDERGGGVRAIDEARGSIRRRAAIVFHAWKTIITAESGRHRVKCIFCSSVR